MNSTLLIALSIFVFVLGFRFYSSFLSKKIAGLDDSRATPAVKFNDGKDYVPIKKWTLYFYHYATIAGSGVIVGPTLAAQYGWLPCILWILAATCLAGGVHDFMVMFLSVRHEGKSIAEVAKQKVGKVSWLTITIAVYFMVVVAIAGMGVGLLSALVHNPLATFTVFVTIPIALLMYLYEKYFKPRRSIYASILGAVMLIFCVLIAPKLDEMGLLTTLDLSKDHLILLIGLYASAASMLPVQQLLAPRNNLSGYMKVFIVGALLFTLLIPREIRMPSVTSYVLIGGPVVSGCLWPFLFIIITCGAISGWHTLCCSGVSPRCISKESDIRVVAYGGWLLESVIAIIALCLACSLFPQDYFAINTAPEIYSGLGMQTVELAKLSQAVGFDLQGKIGGVVSFSISAAKAFSDVFGGQYLKQAYLFMVLFMAIFIMPIMDHGTRMARYFVQDALGIKAANARRWWISAFALTLVMASMWSYLLYTGTISVIWPTFGVCNQLMACIGLTVATSYILKTRRPIYGLVTFWPVLIFASASIHGAFIKIMFELLPLETTAGYIQASILTLFSILFIVALMDTFKIYIKALHGAFHVDRRLT